MKEQDAYWEVEVYMLYPKEIYRKYFDNYEEADTYSDEVNRSTPSFASNPRRVTLFEMIKGMQ